MPHIDTSHKIAGLALSTVLALLAGQPKINPEVDVLNLRAKNALKQARGTDSAASMAEAQDAVQQALRLAPDDFEACKLQVKILLAKHQFHEALERARPLNQGTPDDVDAWGLVSDAAMGLGDYKEAVRTAQWMLNLRSTNVNGLEHGARLREVFGNDEGARAFWESAMRLALADEEQRAWIATQIASLDRRTGRAAQAEGMLRQVLDRIPGYQPAVAEMARVMIEQTRYADAVTLLAERYRKVPRPDVQFELAHALELAGRKAEAQTAYGSFEKAALAMTDAPYNYNRELVLYYTDHAANPGEALRVAKIEIARRQDVNTLDAYAWALYGSGNPAEAQKQMDKALSPGLRDAAFFYHAGVIAAKQKDATAAVRYFGDSLSVSAQSEAGNAARAALKELNPHAD